jgi:methylenetetrahydrofolate reductase (NADPH)
VGKSKNACLSDAAVDAISLYYSPENSQQKVGSQKSVGELFRSYRRQTVEAPISRAARSQAEYGCGLQIHYLRYYSSNQYILTSPPEKRLLTTISQAYGRDKFGLSFELFPPKTDAGVQGLQFHLDRLSSFNPSYMTCTYGAGGSTQDRTLEVISSVRKKYKIPVATHLTCVGSTVDQLRSYLLRAQTLQVSNVVALRGDPPKGETTFKPVEGGFTYANQLVEFIRNEFSDMGIAVAGYPETHVEAPSPEDDLANLMRKVDAGADVIITQLFYENADFFSFRDKCDALGIKVPIVPGLLPVTNAAQIKRITSLCGAKLPASFVANLAKHEDGSDGQFEVGVEFAIKQTAELVAAGVPGIHYYVLNKSEATERVLSAVGLPR